MKRRIFAWAILTGFILLLLNLIVFRYYWQLSMVIYLIILFAFLLTNGKFTNTQSKEEAHGSQQSDDIDMSSDDADQADPEKNDDNNNR